MVMNIPSNLVVQSVGEETIVFNPADNNVHLLNATASKVFAALQVSEPDAPVPSGLFRELEGEAESEITEHTIDLLADKGVVVKHKALNPSRRQFAKAVGLGVVLPTIVSLAAPLPVGAASSSTLSFPSGSITLPPETTDPAPPPSLDITSSCVNRTLVVAAGQTVRITFDGSNIIDDAMSIVGPNGGIAFTSFPAQIGTVSCPGPFPGGGPVPSINPGQPATGTFNISSIFNIPGSNMITICHCDTATPAPGNPSSILPGFTIAAT
jgi:hypothetical protein